MTQLLITRPVKYKKVHLLLIGVTLLNFTPYAQNYPSNDACASFEAIPNMVLCESGSLAIAGSTIWSLSEKQIIVTTVPCSRTEINSPGVWYKLSDYTGSLNIIASGEDDFDTQLSIFTGSCDDLHCMTYNDDAKCHLSSSMVDILADKSEDYYILVHGYGNTVGNFSLHVTGEPCPSNPTPSPLEEPSLPHPDPTSLTIYPNPVEELLTVVLPEDWRTSGGQLNWQVLNILGQVLLGGTTTTATTSIPIAPLIKGSYYLQVYDPLTSQQEVLPFHKK